MEKIPLTQLDLVVEKLLTLLPQSKKSATLVTLSGDLGAGKTTFTQVLGKRLGITELIQSPTYVLMKSYPIQHLPFTTLIHIDAYRLATPEEFKTLKPQDFFADPHNLVVLEWPEQVGALLPQPDIRIKFSSDGASEDERYIEIEHV